MTEQHTPSADNNSATAGSAIAVADHPLSVQEDQTELDVTAALPEISEPSNGSEVSDDRGDDAVDADAAPRSEFDADAPNGDEDEQAEDGTDLEALPALVEALLFVADQPIEANALARALNVTPLRARRALDQLGESLRDNARGVRLQVGPDGAQLVTAPEAATTVELFLGLEASRRLSNAALETLAIIAYRQPVTRHVVDQIRGVDSGGAIATLRARNLIEAVGRAPGPGRPVLFSTTQRFLEHFGLERAQDLPALPDDVDLPPEEPGSQLALDQAVKAELHSDTAGAATPLSDESSTTASGIEAAADAFMGEDSDQFEETAFDLDDGDIEISADLDDLSRAAGAAFGTSEEPENLGS